MMEIAKIDQKTIRLNIQEGQVGKDCRPSRPPIFGQLLTLGQRQDILLVLSVSILSQI